MAGAARHDLVALREGSGVVGIRSAGRNWLNRVAIARARLGLVPPVCESIETWAAERQGAPSQLLFAPRRIERALPRTIEPEIHEEYRSRLIANQRGRYLVPVNGATLVGANGLVMLPDGSFAAESVYGRPNVEEEPAYYALRRRPVVAKAGNYFSLVVKWAVGDGNYYHWLHDTLERLYGVIPLLPDDTRFIVPAALKPFQRESLQLLGIEEHRLAVFSGEESWRLERLYFAPPVNNSGSHRRDADEWLRDRLFDGLGITPSSTPNRRIFISRRGMPNRRLVNEAEVQAFLGPSGFETCAPETLTLRDQVELFSQAEVVVSTHGAAFTNILFSPSGLTVVDMVQPSMLKWAYVFWAMSEELGHRYWYFNAQGLPHAGHQDDTYVPIEKLAATFEQLQIG